MTNFIPDGYCAFKDALNAVGNSLFGATWKWRDPNSETDYPLEDLLSAKIKNVDLIKSMGVSDKPAGAVDPQQNQAALDWLRQRLFDGSLPSFILGSSGSVEIPKAIWGTEKWDSVVSSGQIEFTTGTSFVGRLPIPQTFSGSVLVLRHDLEAVLAGCTTAVRGRPKGAGSYENQDAPLVQEMHQLILAGKAKSVNAAAIAVADRAQGASPESRAKRLSKRYRESFPKKSG